MKLRSIDKARYRHHLNIIIVAFVVSFALLALAYGALLIAAFADGSGSNFKLNLIGVILALVTCGAVIHHFKHHPFCHEVYYVWQLKQGLNLITRKLAKVKKAVAENDINAIIIFYYYLSASEQLYTLDDNTITMSSLVKEKEKLAERIDSLQLSLSCDDYCVDLLANY